MDLARHLDFFVEVARRRHFGAAADALGMTQPPLSQGIQRLERRWETRLFDRSARRVELTPAGAALLPLAQRALDALRDVEDASRALASAEARLRFAVCPDALPRAPWVWGAVRSLSGLPTLEPQVIPSDDALRRLAAGLIDLALVRYPAVLPGLEALEVFRVPTDLVVADGHDWRDGPITLTARSGHPAAHDQTVDALRRLGWGGELRTVASAAEGLALAAIGGMAALVLAPLPGEERGALPPGLRHVQLPGDPVPLRFVLVRSGVALPDRADQERVRGAVASVLPGSSRS